MRNTTQTKIRKRININLPEDTLNLVDRIAEKGERSRLIDKAVRFYVEQRRSANLNALFKEGAIARAQRSVDLAEGWFF